MNFYLNEIRMLGRATRPAELKTISENSKVATFRLASNRSVKKRDGTYQNKATYIDCEAWGARADYAKERIKTGTVVLVGGQLETDEWQAADGTNRSKIKIYCNSVQAPRVDSGGGSDSSGSSDSSSGSSEEDPPF